MLIKRSIIIMIGKEMLLFLRIQKHPIIGNLA